MADESVPGARERQTLADAIRALAKSRAQSRAQIRGESGGNSSAPPHARGESCGESGGDAREAEAEARALFEEACGELTQVLLRASSELDEPTPPVEVPLYSGDDGLGQLLATYCQPPELEPKDGAGEG